jgi:hypothetical protein
MAHGLGRAVYDSSLTGISHSSQLAAAQLAVHDAHLTAHDLGRMVFGAQFTENGLRPHDLLAIANGPHFKQSLPQQEKVIF